MHNRADVKLAQVLIFLADTHIQDGFACTVAHGDGGAHLIIDCVEFRKDYGIDLTTHVVRTILGDSLNNIKVYIIELGDLVNSVVAHKRLPDEHH